MKYFFEFCRNEKDLLTYLLLENFDDAPADELDGRNGLVNDNTNEREEEEDSSPESLTELTSYPKSIVFNQEIFSWIRYIVPICLCGTIILFITSNLSDGATVELQLTSASGKTHDFPLPIFKFSLANTIEEMYHARVYTLMMIVLVFSGIWPYVKLIMVSH